MNIKQERTDPLSHTLLYQMFLVSLIYFSLCGLLGVSAIALSQIRYLYKEDERGGLEYLVTLISALSGATGLAGIFDCLLEACDCE